MDEERRELQILQRGVAISVHLFPHKQEIPLWMLGQELLKVKQKRKSLQISTAQTKFKPPHDVSSLFTQTSCHSFCTRFCVCLRVFFSSSHYLCF